MRNHTNQRRSSSKDKNKNCRPPCLISRIRHSIHVLEGFKTRHFVFNRVAKSNGFLVVKRVWIWGISDIILYPSFHVVSRPPVMKLTDMVSHDSKFLTRCFIFFTNARCFCTSPMCMINSVSLFLLSERNCSSWNEMKWNEMKWNEMKRNEMTRNRKKGKKVRENRNYVDMSFVYLLSYRSSSTSRILECLPLTEYNS